MGFDLAAVVQVSGSDQLVVSLNNANDEASWSSDVAHPGPQWTVLPFDDNSRSVPSPLTIDGVYLANLPQPGQPQGVQTCFVDIWKSPPASNPAKILERYYIDLNKGPRWHKHTLPIDLSAGTISCSLGRRERDFIGGIYTFGKIQTTQELIYATAYIEYDSTIPPRPARLKLPTGTTAIASALNTEGRSNLFLACQEGLYHLPPSEQNNNSVGHLIMKSPIVANTVDLEARTSGGITAV